MTKEHPLNSLQTYPDAPATISEAGRQEWQALIKPVVLVKHTREVDFH